MATYSFFVNGQEITTEENKSLLRFLRDDLHLTSVKDGCSEGACGTCTVVIDGIATKGCVMTTKLAQGKHILTVEGLTHEEQEAFRLRLRRRGRRAVRLLHPRHGDERRRPGAPVPRPHRGRGQVGDSRQRVPLHRLQEDHRGHPACRCRPSWREAD